jgi:hypothetical protein
VQDANVPPVVTVFVFRVSILLESSVDDIDGDGKCDCDCNDPVNADPVSVDLHRTARRLTRGLLHFVAAVVAVLADLIIIVTIVMF